MEKTETVRGQRGQEKRRFRKRSIASVEKKKFILISRKHVNMMPLLVRHRLVIESVTGKMRPFSYF